LEISSFNAGTNLNTMKQITMNGTANALQVAAVIFLFGITIISPADRSEGSKINIDPVEKVKQNNEETKFSSYNVMGSYFQEVEDERLSQPLYLHPSISAGPVNTLKPVHTAFPFPEKKIETVKAEKKIVRQLLVDNSR
jgi:hypothetical protein